ncbi:hypothetical protein VN97_g64 [Penicillium thymicola]|uniref:Uncharacterized protein n=1 Tax=Penicillium thymicola TaxID=293382 RepID=A0AAI9TV86_PENTH|nr:hypothetical protein VN97_g64 [Penicillium thymicola]
MGDKTCGSPYSFRLRGCVPDNPPQSSILNPQSPRNITKLCISHSCPPGHPPKQDVLRIATISRSPGGH